MEPKKRKRANSDRICSVCKNSNHARYVLLKNNEIGDCMSCFNLSEPRSGYLCAACHLRLHRWVQNRTPKSKKSWNHVVDSYEDRNKKKTSTKNEAKPNPVPETRGRKRNSTKIANDNVSTKDSKKEKYKKKENGRKEDPFSIQLVGWSLRNICCGKILVGPNQEVLIDRRLLKPHDGACVCNALYFDTFGDGYAVETDEETPEASSIVQKPENNHMEEVDGYTTESSSVSPQISGRDGHTSLPGDSLPDSKDTRLTSNDLYIDDAPSINKNHISPKSSGFICNETVEKIT